MAAIHLDRRFRGECFDDPEAAEKWLSKFGKGWGRYFCGNPVEPGAVGKVKAKQILAGRVVLFDPDPDAGTSMEDSPASREVALASADYLDSTVGSRPTVIDSGRGAQGWISTDPALPGEEREWLVDHLAAKFRREGIKFDRLTNLDRLMRCPGTINQKTGRTATILKVGSGVPVTSEMLRRLGYAPSQPKAPTVSPPGSTPYSQIRGPSPAPAVATGVPQGHKHLTIFREASRLRGLGTTIEEARPVILELAKNCRPPAPEADALAILDDVWKRYPDGEEKLTRARQLVAGLADKAKADPGAPFEPAALDALRLVRAKDPPAWARARAAFAELKLVGEIERVLVEQAPAIVEEGATGTAVTFADPQPWPEPVNAAELLDALEATFRRYLIAPFHAFIALALWVVQTYAPEVFEHTPRLAFKSPTMRSGKSRALALLLRAVRRPLACSNVTAAALFRAVEVFRPTLLIDEADSFVPENEELRGILNAGFEPDGVVVRCVGDDHEPRRFSAFAPAALAAIGKLPGTIEDRSIIIAMKRKKRGEKTERVRRKTLEKELEPLRRKMARWIADHRDALEAADPGIPDVLDDRAADCWRSLLAIADAVGGEWPKRARVAATALSGDRDEGDGAESILLLGDLRELFLDGIEKLATSTILEALNANEERPWSEHGRGGKPLSSTGLARLLKDYGIRPGTIRVQVKDAKTGVMKETTPKGYKLEDLSDAFARYLSNATAPQARHDKDLRADTSRHKDRDVADPSSPQGLGTSSSWRRGGSEPRSGNGTEKAP
ncbi:DUF3631 domain-containing protein [bacterium]|nr:DUF3631 domain-containing protein [bacterium]